MLMHDEYDAAGFTAPSPMEGHGAYNRSSHVQAAGLAAAIPLLRLAAETAPLAPAPEPIVIADYEASVIPRHLGRAHRSAEQRFQRAVRGAGKRSRLLYPRGEQATFASAVGRSFYQQLLPSNSVTLGWSSWSGNGLLARLP